MEQTTHFHLNKPEKSDYAKIQPISENMDIIDDQLKAAQDHRNSADVHVTAAQKTTWDEKVPQTRTINGQPLSADIDLDAEDVGADTAGSAQAVQDNLNTHAANMSLHVTAALKNYWMAGSVCPLTHTKSGTVHKLTGLNGANTFTNTLSCVFKATAAFAAGDTFTVDGTAYSVQLSNGETPDDNLFISGATVAVVIDTAGKKVNFKAGGGKHTTVTQLITYSQDWECPENVTKIRVELYGGGAGGSYNTSGSASSGQGKGGNGGNGGDYNSGIFTVIPKTKYPVTIGVGGSAGNAGGTTSFSTLLSANGGAATVTDSSNYSLGGNGARSGGLGGGRTGTKPEFGGLGGTQTTSSNHNKYGANGTNTVGMGLEFEGTGTGGASGKTISTSGTSLQSYGGNGGNGGYGGKGGNGGDGNTAGIYGDKVAVGGYGGPGGGGGYGGNGGNGGSGGKGNVDGGIYTVSGGIGGGGGGGGYGGNGGNGGWGTSSSSHLSPAMVGAGGGGGGYGPNGNGGYGNSGAGGDGGIAAGGGGGSPPGKGGNGIAIITIYI